MCNYCGWTKFVGICRGIIIPGSLWWCRISASHSIMLPLHVWVLVSASLQQALHDPRVATPGSIAQEGGAEPSSRSRIWVRRLPGRKRRNLEKSNKSYPPPLRLLSGICKMQKKKSFHPLLCRLRQQRIHSRLVSFGGH